MKDGEVVARGVPGEFDGRGVDLMASLMLEVGLDVVLVVSPWISNGFRNSFIPTGSKWSIDGFKNT